MLYIYSNCTFKLRKCQWEWDRNDIFAKFISSSHPTCIVCRNWESNFSLLGPRQLALPVEFGNPISLCWGPAKVLLE
ncbi:conserved hypothetical protein [Staphylococcus aureus subsp. aureus WBG10049]|nr:conserved hypothetical protein [Staphylococcus aureus subsp. aureus WBG10049]